MFLVPYLWDPPRMCATNIGLSIYLLTFVDFGLLYSIEFLLVPVPFLFSPALYSLFRLTSVNWSVFSVVFRSTPVYSVTLEFILLCTRLTTVYSVLMEFILRCIPFKSDILRNTGVYFPLYSILVRYTPLY